MGKEVKNMAVVSLEIPEELVNFVMDNNKEEQLKRNAMMLYPYIHDGIISHGRAAEILGIYKMDLIVLYGKLGISCIEMTEEELNEELKTVNYLKEVMG